MQWLRDELQILRSAAESEALAASVPDTHGVYFVPAFTGLGAPHWDMYARGLLIGLTRGTSRAHIVRAALEAMAYQTCDVINSMMPQRGCRSRSYAWMGGGDKRLCHAVSERYVTGPGPTASGCGNDSPGGCLSGWLSRRLLGKPDQIAAQLASGSYLYAADVRGPP